MRRRDEVPERDAATCMNSEHGGHPTCPHQEQAREDLLAHIARVEQVLLVRAEEVRRDERETCAAILARSAMRVAAEPTETAVKRALKVMEVEILLNAAAAIRARGEKKGETS